MNSKRLPLYLVSTYSACVLPRSRLCADLMFRLTMQLYPMPAGCARRGLRVDRGGTDGPGGVAGRALRLVFRERAEYHIIRRFVMISSPRSPLFPFVSSTEFIESIWNSPLRVSSDLCQRNHGRVSIRRSAAAGEPAHPPRWCCEALVPDAHKRFANEWMAARTTAAHQNESPDLARSAARCPLGPPSSLYSSATTPHPVLPTRYVPGLPIVKPSLSIRAYHIFHRPSAPCVSHESCRQWAAFVSSHQYNAGGREYRNVSNGRALPGGGASPAHGAPRACRRRLWVHRKSATSLASLSCVALQVAASTKWPGEWSASEIEPRASQASRWADRGWTGRVVLGRLGLSQTRLGGDDACPAGVVSAAASALALASCRDAAAADVDRGIAADLVQWRARPMGERQCAHPLDRSAVRHVDVRRDP